MAVQLATQDCRPSPQHPAIFHPKTANHILTQFCCLILSCALWRNLFCCNHAREAEALSSLLMASAALQVNLGVWKVTASIPEPTLLPMSPSQGKLYRQPPTHARQAVREPKHTLFISTSECLVLSVCFPAACCSFQLHFCPKRARGNMVLFSVLTIKCI